MFKILTVRDEVRVPPTKFGMDLNTAVRESLQDQVEGRIDPDVGLFLSVVEILKVGEGRIIPEDGAIYYPAEFKILTYVPELNEIVLAEVVDITEFGAFARIGPIDALVHVSQVMDDKVSYNPKSSIFIGRKTGKKLQEGDIVRARVVGVSLGKGGRSKISLSMRQPGLGALEWIEKDKKRRKE